MGYEEGRLVDLFEDYSDMPELCTHLALVALQNGYLMSAMTMFRKGIPETCDSQTPPDYYELLLHGMNAQMIIEVKQGDMNRAVCMMNRRLTAVSKWIGSASLELAHDLHRLGCFHSLLDRHRQC